MVEKAKREAAGYVCLGAFHAAQTVCSMLSSLEWEMREGMTEQERAFIRKKRLHLHDEAEVLRQLGWRFINNNRTPGGKPARRRSRG